MSNVSTTATCSMLLPDMAVQVVPTSEDGIAFIADEFVFEVHFRDMTNNALLIHLHPALCPFAPDFGLAASYNSVLVTQVDQEHVPDDRHVASRTRNHPSANIWLLFDGTGCIF